MAHIKSHYRPNKNRWTYTNVNKDDFSILIIGSDIIDICCDLQALESMSTKCLECKITLFPLLHNSGGI